MIQQKHIINKVFLDVETNSNTVAFKLKDNLAVFFKHQVFPKIENYFEKHYGVSSDVTIRLNKVEIDINKTHIDQLPEIANQIVEQLKKKIDGMMQRAEIHSENSPEWTLSTNSKSKLDAFIYFLKTGHKPWWSPNFQALITLQDLKTFTSEKSFYSEMVKALSINTVRERLVNQFGNEALWIVLSASGFKKSVAKKKVFEILDKDDGLRNQFWNVIIQCHTLKRTSLPKETIRQFTKVNKRIAKEEYLVLKTFIESIIKQPFDSIETFETTAKEGPNISTEILVPEDGFFVENAGLVLLHPFLKQFFVNAKFTDSNGKIKPSQMETAIHLLYYLSKKEEQQLESELVLEKFLCGYPINKPMRRFVKLPKGLKQMAEEVLQSVISHWTVLKNTSPDALRTGFLQRDGKLIIENETGRLIVERKGQDILLDKTPWNINLIKLPWRDKIIYVEW